MGSNECGASGAWRRFEALYAGGRGGKRATNERHFERWSAIGIYLETGSQPENVASRQWRGVYHHWGEPGDLGNRLLDELRRVHGDLELFVEHTVSEAPFGWSSLGDPYSDESAAEPVCHDDTSQVAFCYVLDTEARRLDVFATHADASGERLFSASIDAAGIPTPRFFDLDEAEERADDDNGKGSPIRAVELELLFLTVLPLEAGRYSVHFRYAREAEDGTISVCVQVHENDEDGTLCAIAE